MSVYKHGDDYHTLFETDAYLQACCTLTDTGTELGQFFVFLLDNLHEIFSTVGCTLPSKATLLDLGSGPTIQYLVSASKHVSSIILSDFVESNRESLWTWISGQKNAHDFSPFFKYIAKKEESDWHTKQSEFREKVTGILPCDLLQSNPLYPSLLSPLDVVCSSLCLQAVATDMEEYKTLVRNISNILKPGGWVVLTGTLGESFYQFGSVKFHGLPMSKKDVTEAWESSGFAVHTLKQYDTSVLPVSDCSGVFCMCARKND